MSALPDGEWSASDELDGGIAIRCTIRLDSSSLEVDLTDSDAQVLAPVNTVEAVAVSAACFVLHCLVPADVPVNAGCWRPLRVVTRPGTIVAASPRNSR